MALDLADVALIVDLVRRGPQPARILGLGHPDILATPAELAPLFGGRLLPADNERMRRDRLGKSPEDCLGSAVVLCDALGAELVALDRRDLFGVAENVDLNYPLAERHRGAYSLVIDPGTIEHILNAGQALASVLGALRVGGHAYHASPMVMLNHGYWNFSPAAYHDFYTANGCEIVRLEGRRKGRPFAVPATRRFRPEGEGGKLMLTCVARKLRETDAVVWPMQEKYLA